MERLFFFEGSDNYFKNLDQYSCQPRIILNQALIGYDLIDSINMFYIINKKHLILLSQNQTFNTIQSANFMKLVRPCFVDFFIKTFNNYFSHIVLNTNKNSMNSIKFLMPLQLNNEEYIYSSLYFTPVFDNNLVIGFYLIILPIKTFEKEYFSFNIYKKHKDFKLASAPPELFTDKQKLIVNYIEKGHISSNIANILNLKIETIYKMNIKIKNILSDFFDIEFTDTKEAINYYNHCFLANL